MKLLLIHADSFEYNTRKKAVTKPEQIGEEMSARSIDNVLVVFTTVEEGDVEDEEQVIQNASEEITSLAKRLSVSNVHIYPFSHLSPNILRDGEACVRILKNIEEKLLEKGFKATRSPYGYYKSFSLRCKGHPLSELSRTISPTPKPKEKERRVSELFLLAPTGAWSRVETYTFDKGEEDLADMVRYELGEQRESGEPPHIQTMREKELVDYEPLSDPGNLRWYPKGKLVKDLLAMYAEKVAISLGAAIVETPIMYDLSKPEVGHHAERFGERQYRMSTEKRDLMLRYAACFGQFSIKRDMPLLWYHLPLRTYELAQYCFRYEQRGELVGLRRLRAFTMPDLHTLCKDLEEAKKEVERQHLATLRVAEDLGVSYQTAFRTTKDFLEKNREWVEKLAEKTGKTVLVEVLPERNYYWVFKTEVNVLDANKKAAQLGTVQIDVENAQNFGITFLDEENRVRHPVLLHCSPTGGIERIIFALLESAHRTASETGRPPMLPTWLSPIQVRVIPIAERHKNTAEKVLNKLLEAKIRADVDDRKESLAKRVRDAAREWIPYTAVIGDEEQKNNKLRVTFRQRSTLDNPYQEVLSVEQLIAEVERQVRGKPFKPLTIPTHLSQRPHYK